MYKHVEDDVLKDKNIVIDDVTVVYNSSPAVENISLDIDFNDFIAVVGPNGAGKSTIAKVILGLVKPLKGDVSVFGYNPLKEGDFIRRLIGYVPQYIRISQNIPISILETVLMGILAVRKPPRFPSRRDIRKALNALKIVNMDAYKNKSVHELSGGERQRVLIARALAREPRYLILDEPFAGVDVKSQREIINFLYDYHMKNNIGLFIIVHDLAPLINYIDKILLINRKVVAYGSPVNVLTKDNIKITYGIEVPILERGNICYPLLGDMHKPSSRR